MRVACLAVPLFPLAARLRCEPELRGEAVAIVEGNGPAARVLAASRRARGAGIAPGQTLAQAQTLLPRLVGRARDVEGERAAQEVLLELAEGFSPRVEDAGPGLLFLDLDGCVERFTGSRFASDPEHELARSLLLAADRAALPARAGIACSKLAAQVASTLVPTPQVVTPGEEPAFLAPLPLRRLAPEIEIAETLQRWGVRTIGELARLPAAEVASRLGEVGRELHARARGVDPRPLVAREPPPDLREGMSLEWPLVAIEPFLFLARAALDRLTARLAGCGLACLRLALSLRLEPDGWKERLIELPAPTRDVKVLLTLLRLELEKAPPGAPVSAFALAAHPDRPRVAQRTLFGPQEIPPDRLATTLARLFALLGPGRTGAPVATDGHRPERFTLTAFDPPPAPLVRPDLAAVAPPGGRGLLAVRVLRPPVPLEVLVEDGGDGVERPSQVASPAAPEGEDVGAGRRLVSVDERRRRGGKRRPRIAGRVRIASGPWAVEEGWWVAEPVAREYWDVELEEGGIYRLFKEPQKGVWFADGVYD
ncbi:MAG TPA: DNA polymerase Y family protein [Thermoanaerobaculia bacterium]|nr:DNA polymerase Y family protein [Thermoanaerobaculia bacterium]